MKINVSKQVDHWLQTATSDFETAKVIFAAGKNYHHSCFFCHLVVEKHLKALVVRVTEQLAPYSHDLIYLAERANLLLEENEREFCELLNRFVIEARYPDEKYQLYKLQQENWQNHALQKRKNFKRSSKHS
ncbi:MAG: HEPN domain-containing protein [Bacteroidetes bacterium]|nr:HEPN domain-containing protein [Bacteroidota bacterium]MCW5895061.1 HEPN domain-containing protein [Bacteroidota bacterium]